MLCCIDGVEYMFIAITFTLSHNDIGVIHVNIHCQMLNGPSLITFCLDIQECCLDTQECCLDTQECCLDTQECNVKEFTCY